MALRLAHRPGEWDGSFAVTLAALCEDILTDGPVTVTVEYESNGTGDIRSFTGTLWGIKGGASPADTFLQFGPSGQVAHVLAVSLIAAVEFP